jgi:2-dehydro-3-deoxyphosphogluconate aldolase/(4S)-4-hydroxy-2-oxoglutarate aldolase
MDALSVIRELPLIGILRAVPLAKLPPLLDAVVRGGLRNIEVTMNSPGAIEQIRQAGQNEALNVGAGTVTSVGSLEEALRAGARFVVTPLLNGDVIAECVRRNVPVFPGAFSPTEICEAWELGATMVKVFPADAGGPEYIRALGGPFPKIKLLPTGGVHLKTAADFLKAGAAGLGVGSPLFDKARIEAADWPWLAERTRQFVEIVRAGRR